MEEQFTNEGEGISSNASQRVEIIIPTLNEEHTIGKLIRNIRSHLLPLNISISVIDGGSTDKTLDICEKENVKITIQKGKGKGNAMRQAVDNTKAEIVVFIDADGTYEVSDLGMLLDPLINNKADMVIGSRLNGKIEKGSISLLNMIGNKIFNSAINFAMNSHVTDSLSGYRAMFSNVFRDLVLFSNNFEIEVEMTVEALAKITES
jgi:glycosyltransferase involved in cell wall biosynthesis